MRAIRDWRDLEPEGILLLTGESCAYTYRVLCDVTARGIELLGQLLGTRSDLARLKETATASFAALVALLPEEDPHDLDCQNVADLLAMVEPLLLPESWNARPGFQWSVMLPHELFRPLAVFALIRAGCRDICALDSGPVFGFTAAEQIERDRYLECWQGEKRSFRLIHNPGYARHRHQMSGRSE